MWVLWMTIWIGCTPTSPKMESVAAPVLATIQQKRTKTVISKPYEIDQKYASMRGPYGFDDVKLFDTKGKPELLWITGYRTTVVDADSGQELSQEYMCHANLDFEAKDYYKAFPTAPPISGRVFTLSQGQQDIVFPEGFGIPITSELSITLATQVLNLNMPEIDLNVRHRVQIDFVRDVEVKGEMIPLFQGAVEGFKALDANATHYGFSDDEIGEESGTSCSVGQAAIAGESDDDQHGKKFTAHWVVEPGEEVTHTNVTRFLSLPYDTEAHYIAVHLHPFATKLVLRDLTEQKDVYEALAKNTPDHIGLSHVDHYESTKGITLYKGHQYELVSYYNNTSTEPVDSMAVMYLYMRDKRFTKPAMVSSTK